MGKRFFTRIVFILIILQLGILNCTSSFVSQRDLIQVEENRIYAGMTLDQFVEIYGKPEISFNLEFGKNKGKPWNGLVYKYYSEFDPLYQEVERRYTNTYVFNAEYDPPRLNHWKIEYNLQYKRKTETAD